LLTRGHDDGEPRKKKKPEGRRLVPRQCGHGSIFFPNAGRILGKPCGVVKVRSLKAWVETKVGGGHLGKRMKLAKS